MPMYDYECACGEQFEALRSVKQSGWAPCPAPRCNGIGDKVWRANASSVIADDIPGGMEVRHGICNPDGTPKRYYSKSEMAKAAAASGWTNYVVHNPPPGTDKSKHTNRWV
jgi:putative FmdB family regulatory protein